ncbi:unnamed protein product [Symbiodinium microadriaticum]|nr:unnamed protein product [Symbiodinium microadriaticum]
MTNKLTGSRVIWSPCHHICARLTLVGGSRWNGDLPKRRALQGSYGLCDFDSWVKGVQVKLTTKQLRKMFSPRQPPGIEVSSPRRTYRRWSEEQLGSWSDPNSEFEELSSFGGDQEDTSWIDEFLSAPARRDSWHAPASLKENQLLRVTNDDLQEACLRGDLGLVKRLINARASVNAPIRPQDADEFMTLLHVLARKPHMQNCSSIIAEMVRNKANLNVRSSLGTTPLSLACHAKHTEAVEVLLRAKASADPIDDYGKKAPLYAILPPWDETLVDNADEADVKEVGKSLSVTARGNFGEAAGTNLDDGGDNSPIVESVSPTQEEVLVDPGIAWLKIELNPCEVPRSKKTEREGLAPQKKAFYDASQLELLEDLDLQDVDKKHKVVFQQLVSQILTINRSFTTGIRRSDLKEWHEMSKFRPATSEDHQHFVGQVLSNAQLMAQSSRAMRAVHESLLTGAEELNEKPLDRVQLLSFLAKAVHDMKLCTAHLCWHDFVKPLRERKDELELGLQRLRTQLRMTRETYLKEVSALRDHARSRWDPMDGFADVVLFYEPLQSLEPEEKSFMAEMVREVIKSLVDVNPEFARVVNSGQIDRLIFEAHQKQLDDLQQKLDQKSARVKELLEVKQYLESQMAKGGKMAAPDNSVLAKYEQMMRLMEDQLGCLRVDFWNMQQDHQKLQQEQQQADAERAELARKLEKEQAENQVLQEEVTRLCGVEEGFKDTIQRMEIEKSNLKHSVHELQTRATHLNRALQRRAHHRTHEAPEHAGQEEAEEHDLALPSVVESGFEAWG